MITHETIMDPAALLIWLRKHENNKTDPHTEFAAFLYGIPIESVGSSDRNRAKAALYLHLFGGSPLYAPIAPRCRFKLGYTKGFGSRSWVRGYEAMLRNERFRYEPRNRRIAAHCWEARGYRRWGRWDDILYWHDLNEVDFYTKFGVDKTTATEAIHWVLSDVALLMEIYAETREDDER